MRFDIKLFGDRKLRQELEDVGERARDLKPAFWVVLRTVIVPRYRQRFADAAMKPLAPSTIERKSRQGLDPRVLRATGALEAALTSGGRAPNQTQSVGKTRVRRGAGKRLYYARFVNAARTLFGWERSDERKATQIVERFLLR